MELITNNLVIVMAIIGVLAFIVSVITEVTKEIGIFKRIPTDLQVIVLSLFLCLFSYFAYCSYSGMMILWYLIVGIIIGSFIVSFVAMFGWEKLINLYERFKGGE